MTTKLEIGTWYKTKNGMLLNFQGIYSREADNGTYGFNTINQWGENLGVALDGVDEYTEASNSEVLEALLKETIKQYGEDWRDVKIKVHASGKDFGINRNLFITSTDIEGIWNTQGELYSTGKWAEKLEEEVDAEKPIDTLEEILDEMAKEVADVFAPKQSETKQEAPQHYNNLSGSLYKFAEDHGLNSYEFDIIKRVVRCRKKGAFREDLEKTKFLIELYLKENEQQD